MIALFTGNSHIDPQGRLLFLSIWLALVGVPIVLCATTLSIAISSLWHRLRDPECMKRKAPASTLDRRTG